MLKEIYEQPAAVARTIEEYLVERLARARPRALRERASEPPKVVVLACGTAYHAGVVGRYVIEEWARVPCEPDIASEWRYRHPVLTKDTLVIGITQSGETADTLAAMQRAREMGARTAAITNHQGTQMTRDVERVLYTRAGLEMGVAASKTFTVPGRAPLPRGAQARRGPEDAARGGDPEPPGRGAVRFRTRSPPTWTATIRSRRSRGSTTRSRSSSTSAGTSGCRSASRARSSSRRSPTSRPRPTRRAR